MFDNTPLNNGLLNSSIENSDWKYISLNKTKAVL